MTPEFAKAVDPIFVRVLGVLERIGRDEPVSPQDERAALLGSLSVAQAHLGDRPDWQPAKYALVSWIDEVLIEAPWKGHEWWINNTLEWELFQLAETAQRFYTNAKEASASSNWDALEVSYVCVVLGFRGIYRDPNACAALTEPLGLPPDLETWARQVSMMIQLRQGRRQIPNITEPLQPAVPLEGQFMLIWSVFLGMILSAATGILALVFYGS